MNISQKELDHQIEQAIEAGQREPKATSARFDQANDRIVVELDSRVTFMFPVDLAQGLANATAEELAEVEVTPGGLSVHWEARDVDLSITGLLAGIFGSKAWMSKVYSTLGKKGGRRTSAAKTAASRANGKLGGRPKSKAK